MNNLDAALTLIKSNLEVNLLPVIIGALQVLQKDPSVVGIAAAEAYLLGNAPAALLIAKATLMQTVINDLNAQMQKLVAASVQAAALPKA